MKSLRVPVFTGSNQEEFLKQVGIFLRELSTQLQFLDLASSYQNCFISDAVTIGAGSEVSIPNKRPDTLMNSMVPVSLSDANGILTKGATEWTYRTLYVKNQGSASITAKILFFRQE